MAESEHVEIAMAQIPVAVEVSASAGSDSFSDPASAESDPFANSAGTESDPFDAPSGVESDTFTALNGATSDPFSDSNRLDSYPAVDQVDKESDLLVSSGTGTGSNPFSNPVVYENDRTIEHASGDDDGFAFNDDNVGGLEEIVKREGGFESHNIQQATNFPSRRLSRIHDGKKMEFEEDSDDEEFDDFDHEDIPSYLKQVVDELEEEPLQTIYPFQNTPDPIIVPISGRKEDQDQNQDHSALSHLSIPQFSPVNIGISAMFDDREGDSDDDIPSSFGTCNTIGDGGIGEMDVKGVHKTVEDAQSHQKNKGEFDARETFVMHHIRGDGNDMEEVDLQSTEEEVSKVTDSLILASTDISMNEGILEESLIEGFVEEVTSEVKDVRARRSQRGSIFDFFFGSSGGQSETDKSGKVATKAINIYPEHMQGIIRLQSIFRGFKVREKIGHTLAELKMAKVRRDAFMVPSVSSHVEHDNHNKREEIVGENDDEVGSAIPTNPGRSDLSKTKSLFSMLFGSTSESTKKYFSALPEDEIDRGARILQRFMRKVLEREKVNRHLRCENCVTIAASRFCMVCEELYCSDCWRTVHGAGRRSLHDFIPAGDDRLKNTLKIVAKDVAALPNLISDDTRENDGIQLVRSNSEARLSLASPGYSHALLYPQALLKGKRSYLPINTDKFPAPSLNLKPMSPAAFASMEIKKDFLTTNGRRVHVAAPVFEPLPSLMSENEVVESRRVFSFVNSLIQKDFEKVTATHKLLPNGVRNQLKRFHRKCRDSHDLVSSRGDINDSFDSPDHADVRIASTKGGSNVNQSIGNTGFTPRRLSGTAAALSPEPDVSDSDDDSTSFRANITADGDNEGNGSEQKLVFTTPRVVASTETTVPDPEVVVPSDHGQVEHIFDREIEEVNLQMDQQKLENLELQMDFLTSQMNEALVIQDYISVADLQKKIIEVSIGRNEAMNQIQRNPLIIVKQFESQLTRYGFKLKSDITPSLNWKRNEDSDDEIDLAFSEDMIEEHQTAGKNQFLDGNDSEISSDSDSDESTATVNMKICKVPNCKKMIIKFKPSLWVVVYTIYRGTYDIVITSTTLLLYVYIFAVLGMIIFSSNDPWHFNQSLEISMMTLYRVLTLDDWGITFVPRAPFYLLLYLVLIE